MAQHDSFLGRFRRRFFYTCRDVNRFLADYVDEALPPDQQERFERHIALCSHCKGYIDEYRATLALMGEAGRLPSELPDELVESTLAFLRGKTKSDG
jgi:anti-sigma factor RsiW